MNILDSILRDQKSGIARGIPSVCSAHPLVLEAVFKHAKTLETSVLIEATSNQVNQFGGYTSMTPLDFHHHVNELAQALDFPRHNLYLGGDHLGPLPWTAMRAEDAMANARDLVRSYALAGYGKLHLDCSVSCADDRELSPEVMAQRTAELATVAEETSRTAGLPEPRYVIGTEVPAAGGAIAGENTLVITHPEDAARTIELTSRAFMEAGLDSAWNRVIAMVVQPGVEFGQEVIHDYDRSSARDLVEYIESVPNLVYEAHSTDYQRRSALRELVEDHFAILKVGPALTFAFREAVYSLAEIEQLLCKNPSRIQEEMEALMLADPGHWIKHYSGDSRAQKLARHFSFSDRIRYYWNTPRAKEAFNRLMSNLGETPLPLTLISQYFPAEWVEVRNGELPNTARNLLLRRITRVLDNYHYACFS
jgi:D-tagatose-1,6-bisphosphate aldolase subunit GatZ/KbaZ